LEEEVQRHETANQNVEALRAEVKTLQKKNADIVEQIRTLKAQLETEGQEY